MRSESGSASVLMTGVIGFVVALSSAALVIAGYAVGYHRARAAADLSALSGAAAYQGRSGGMRSGRTALPGRTALGWTTVTWSATRSTSS